MIQNWLQKLNSNVGAPGQSGGAGSGSGGSTPVFPGQLSLFTAPAKKTKRKKKWRSSRDRQ